MTIDQIGRYKMHDVTGMLACEIVFCKVTTWGGHIEFATWERKIRDGETFKGHYFDTFRKGLGDFLRRIDSDNGEACTSGNGCDHYDCPVSEVL